ncbi:MAG: chemotaxis protein CheD [Candidatus Krumholzibacteriota bacterium]|nr:chemotaxis protein CheD [Candidatus Krumholzibacteriota bacterium]
MSGILLEATPGARHIVGVADLKFSAAAGDRIITHALGSCLGIAVYDPVSQVGGLLHAMLPDSTIDPEKAAGNPCMFVDTGVPLLFKGCYRLGACKERLIVKVAGGATIRTADKEDYFQIGKRNFVMLRKLLWRNGVMIKSHDVGGSVSRTMTLTIGNGEVTLAINGKQVRL